MSADAGHEQPGMLGPPAESAAKRVRLLLLADSHLGQDLPRNRRSERRRRGPDFIESFEQALAPALSGAVDLVVHGGDLFFRSRVRQEVVGLALERIDAVTGRGIPVVIVPGNHERSAMPFPLLWNRPGIHVFHRPRTVLLEINGMTLALSGFPHRRQAPARHFAQCLAETEWSRVSAGARLLCLHQLIEGATVGPGDFTFRPGDDVIAGSQLSDDFAAVLSGHIHRHQVLVRDLRNRTLACPVVYPGSTERTSFAEMGERKGFVLLELWPTPTGRGRVGRLAFRALPVRPMADLTLNATGLSARALEEQLARMLDGLAPESIVRLTIRGKSLTTARTVLRAARLRRVVPSTMNLSLRWPDSRSGGRPLRRARV